MHEREVVDLLLARDERGLELLLKYYGPLMRYIIAPILPSPQDREECLSEAAMRVWDKIELYQSGRGSWNAWLTALTRNAALNRRRREGPAGQEEIPPELPSGEPSPEESLLEKERRAAQREQLAQALDQLSAGDRALLYRKYYYQQSTAQIASELGITERAAEGRLYRLKQHLRRRMGGERHE